MSEIVKREQQTLSPIPTMNEFSVIQAQAAAIASSNIVPAAYRKNPDNVIVATLAGRPFGWDALTAMRNLTVIQGTATIKPEAMLGLIRAAGHSVSGETSPTKATVTGKRRDTGDEMSFTFTIEDAKRAGLAGKDNWKNYPSSMLWARAVAQLGRMLFPDVLLGLSYVPEEIGATVDENGEAISVVSERETGPAGPRVYTRGELQQAAFSLVSSETILSEEARRGVVKRAWGVADLGEGTRFLQEHMDALFAAVHNTLEAQAAEQDEPVEAEVVEEPGTDPFSLSEADKAEQASKEERPF